ncbi:MAG: DUF6327 family protein [Nonlabens sp.]|nr:DUF6327 family protein [Nonlabens sp.]
MKIYNSFEDIEMELEQLSLQKEIGSVNLKLKFEQAKDALTPATIFSNLVGSIAKKAIALKIVNKIIGR